MKIIKCKILLQSINIMYSEYYVKIELYVFNSVCIIMYFDPFCNNYNTLNIIPDTKMLIVCTLGIFSNPKENQNNIKRKLSILFIQ